MQTFAQKTVINRCGSDCTIILAHFIYKSITSIWWK